MHCGQSIDCREDYHKNNEQYGYIINSTKRFLHNNRILFFSSWNIYVDQLGPFWPTDYPIKHGTLSHLSRTFNIKNSKEYYRFLGINNRQTYDNQPAIYKYRGILKHPIIVYDMDKSSRNQQIKQSDNDQISPQLIFESRFEGGNLRQAPDMFSFDYCKFHIHRCKESTGRVVMWKEMLIKNSFTLEASFAGTSIVERPCHFNIQDYEKFGQCICKSLKQYIDVLYDSTRLESILMDITKSVLHRLDKDKIPFGLLSSIYPEEKQSNESKIGLNSINNCLEILTQCHETLNDQDGSSSSDSDSDPEGDELPDIGYTKEKLLTKQKSKKKTI
ncbi:unnamed protein product [Rotaria sp. Silwood1]|nr:unnamed protein product [Rotaria sp. Silwood1]CAF1688119.1 unnamed protein product [Rotaria sp. Silwood1]